MVKAMKPLVVRYDSEMAELRRQARGERSELRVGYLGSSAQSFLTPALALLRASHPGARLKLSRPFPPRADRRAAQRRSRRGAYRAGRSRRGERISQCYAPITRRLCRGPGRRPSGCKEEDRAQGSERRRLHRDRRRRDAGTQSLDEGTVQDRGIQASFYGGGGRHHDGFVPRRFRVRRKRFSPRISRNHPIPVSSSCRWPMKRLAGI